MMSFDEENGKLWYGIWSRGPRPTYYVGFDTTTSGTDPLIIWLQVMFDGDRAREVPPKSLLPWYNKPLSGPEGDATNFVFTKEIKSPDDTAAAIEDWLVQRLRDMKSWAGTLN